MLASSKTVKVVLLGEGRVGKTSLALRFVHNTFNHSQQASLQASFLTKQIIAGSQQVELAIWDTAGQERFHALDLGARVETNDWTWHWLGLQDVFQAIADQVIDKSPAPGAAQHRPAGRLVVIDDNGVAPQSSTKSSACC
ncbi:hypothetical protein WJX79_007685 [Trebouxia sp. C0005]